MAYRDQPLVRASRKRKRPSEDGLLPKPFPRNVRGVRNWSPTRNIHKSQVNTCLCYILASLSVTEPCHNVFYDLHSYMLSPFHFRSLRLSVSHRHPCVLLYCAPFFCTLCATGSNTRYSAFFNNSYGPISRTAY